MKLRQKTSAPGRTQRVHGSVAAILMASTVVAAPALAQQTSLEQVSTQNNEPQLTSLGGSIHTVCPTLGGGNSGDPDQDDLFARCNSAIGAANQGVAGDANAEATALTALDQIAPQEVLGQRAVVDGIAASQSRLIASRLSVLGGRTGPRIAMNAIEIKPVVAGVLPVATMAQNVEDDGSILPSGLGLFVDGSYNFGERDDSLLESGFDFDEFTITAGVDYFVTDSAAIGFAIGYSSQDVEYDQDAGDVEGDGFNIGVYGLWSPLANLGASLYANYGLINYDTARNIRYDDTGFGTAGLGAPVNRVASGDTDATQVELTGNVYYDVPYNSWTFSPGVRLSYVRSEIDGFTESGASGLNLVFEDQEADSFQTAVGGTISNAISLESGVVLVQGRAEWIHEFLDDAETINVRYASDPANTTFVITTEDPDRDRFLVGAGASFVMAGGFSAYLDLETVLGYEDVSSHTVTGGVRFEF